MNRLNVTKSNVTKSISVQHNPNVNHRKYLNGTMGRWDA